MTPRLIAGIDEAGVGPLAGPVIAAAVVLRRCCRIDGVADSKVLAPAVRESLAREIEQKAVCWALGRAEVEEIDRLNVLRATLLAMQRAVAALDPPPTEAVVDGLHAPGLACPVRAVVRGDARVRVISCASILAKVARDAEMRALGTLYPQYGFADHKGYGTRRHLHALALHGPCAIHRTSFEPVRRHLHGA